MLSLYNVNDNYYDYSCGWAHRLLGSLSLEINYFGTDPNYLLVEKLKEISNLYKRINNINTIVDIKGCGSEIYQPEWEGKMGLAFSSPPYFSLEDYKIGEQSYNQGVSYDSWLSNYFVETVKNIHRYLIHGGYFLINIKNYDKYNLVKDTMDIIEKHGFVYKTFHQLKNIKRTNSKGGLNDNSEKILVFIKLCTT